MQGRWWIEESTLANPPDRQVLLVPLFQLPNPATTSFWIVTCFVLHIALLLLLKFWNWTFVSQVCSSSVPIGNLHCVFINSKSSMLLHSLVKASYLSNVLIQAFQVFLPKCERIGVFLTTPCFTTTACGRCGVMEPGTSTNAQNVNLSVVTHFPSKNYIHTCIYRHIQ